MDIESTKPIDYACSLESGQDRRLKVSAFATNVWRGLKWFNPGCVIPDEQDSVTTLCMAEDIVTRITLFIPIMTESVTNRT